MSPKAITPFRYMGGKASKLDFILPNLPYKTGFLELFAGSAAVIINRQRSKIEHLNDADDRITAFFQVSAE